MYDIIPVQTAFDSAISDKCSHIFCIYFCPQPFSPFFQLIGSTLYIYRTYSETGCRRPRHIVTIVVISLNIVIFILCKRDLKDSLIYKMQI